jgi:hypothetical protein
MDYAILGFIAFTFIGACYAYFLACSDNNTASVGNSGSDNAQVNAIRSMGFRNINLISNAPKVMFTCGKEDTVFTSSAFSATNLAGEKVSGVVCCGFLKGCTIRF